MTDYVNILLINSAPNTFPNYLALYLATMNEYVISTSRTHEEEVEVSALNDNLECYSNELV